MTTDTTPPAEKRRTCNACSWTGPQSETRMLSDHRGGGIGPLCPMCGETTDEAQPATDRPALADALRLAEAALADIGDADREPGDDVAWCEQRAAQALPAVRAALDGAPAREPSDEEIVALWRRFTGFDHLTPPTSLIALARAVRAWPNTGERHG